MGNTLQINFKSVLEPEQSILSKIERKGKSSDLTNNCRKYLFANTETHGIFNI